MQRMLRVTLAAAAVAVLIWLPSQTRVQANAAKPKAQPYPACS